MTTHVFNSVPLTLAAPPPAAILAIAGGVAVVAVVFVLIAMAERARKRKVNDAIVALGGQPLPKKFSKDLQEAFFSRLGPLRDLKHGSKRMRWATDLQRPQGDAGTILLAEHMYLVYAGKHAHPVFHTMAIASCPARWPTFDIKEEHLGHKIVKVVLGQNSKLIARDLEVESADFNARWRVKTDDPDFALVFLSPEMQQAVMRVPKGWYIRVGAGALAVVANAQLKPEMLAKMVETLESIVAQVPDEIWELDAAQA